MRDAAIVSVASKSDARQREADMNATITRDLLHHGRAYSISTCDAVQVLFATQVSMRQHSNEIVAG